MSIVYANKQKLHNLKEHLQRDGHGALLDLLPGHLFISRNGNIIIDPMHRSDDDAIPVFAFFKMVKVPPRAPGTRATLAPGSELALNVSTSNPIHGHRSIPLAALDTQLKAFCRVPQLSWLASTQIEPGEPSNGRVARQRWSDMQDWQEMTFALIQYFLLVWASEMQYETVGLPEPRYEPLLKVCAELEQTQMFKSMKFRGSPNVSMSQAVKQVSRVTGTQMEPRSLELPELEPEQEPLEEVLHTAQNLGEQDVHNDRIGTPAGAFLQGAEVDKINDPNEVLEEDRHETMGLDGSHNVDMLSLNAGSKIKQAPLHPQRVVSLPPEKAETEPDQPSSERPISTTASRLTIGHMPQVDNRYVRNMGIAALDAEDEHHASPDYPPEFSSKAAFESYVGRLNKNPSVLTGTESRYHTTSSSMLEATPMADLEPEVEALLEDASTLMSTESQRFSSTNIIRNHSSTPEPSVALEILQRCVGHALLSVLPSLDQVTFKRLSDDRDFLPLRLLVGTFKGTSESDVRGNTAWAMLERHKIDNIPPSIQLSALNRDTEEIIEERLDIGYALPALLLEPAFVGVRENAVTARKDLTVLVQYYFILAANVKTHGLRQHDIPLNGTFIHILKELCRKMSDDKLQTRRQIQKHKPEKRLRRNKMKISTDNQSDADEDEALDPPLESTLRRSRRLRKQTVSGSLSDAEDEGMSDPPPRKTQCRSRCVRPAAGQTGELHTLPLPDPSSLNEFLDPYSEATSSEGESGDEILPKIPNYIADILKEQRNTAETLDERLDGLKDLQKLQSKAEKEVGKLERHLDRVLSKVKARQDLSYISEVTRGIEVLRLKVWGYQRQLEVCEGAVSGFREKKKGLDERVKAINGNNPSWVQGWSLLKMGRQR